MTPSDKATPSGKDLQRDDTARSEQKSHGSTQNRSKKEGHSSQLGTGSDQVSQRQHGGGARRPPR